MEKKETLQNEEYEEPLKTGGPPRHIRPWNEDDDSNYFMSEPSVSEADSSEYVRPAHIPSLLAPRAESPSSTSSKELFPNNRENTQTPPPPPPGQQRQPPYPNSPGTSISSWDSPHLFRKRVQLYFAPDKGSKHLEVPASKAAQNKGSNKSTSSSSTAVKKRTNDFLKELKQQSVGAVKDARPEDFDSDLSQVNGADRQKVDAVIRNVPPRNNTDATIPQNESTDQDETLVMDLSTDEEEEEEEEEVRKPPEELLDWEGKHHSADDEKTAERPRRPRRGQGSGHRRTRSGDAAAASLMTGGKDWKGMQIDQIPIPFEHDEEDDHDQSHDSEEVHQSAQRSQDNTVTTSKREDSVKSTVEAGGGFVIGSGKNVRISKRPRRNLRVRRPMSLPMERMETDSPHEEERMSRATFSQYALESPRAVPKYVARASPTNESLSTIDHYTSERMESDSSGHGAGPRRHNRAYSDMDFRIPGGRQQTHSDADIFQPQLDHRGSEITFDSSRGHGSPFSWLSSKNEPRLASSWDPQHDYRRNGYQFGDPPEMLNDSYQFGDAEDETSGDTGSEYDSTEEDERDIQSNRFRYDPSLQLDELERLLEGGMRGRAQHVLRHRVLPHENEQEMVSPRTRRATYMPTSHSEGDYPMFVCPVCKTRQREFFTASSAPSQFQGPAGYLALYFAIYVIAALFIFGLEEGWQALDCVYFAVITLTTAGLGDFVPTSDGAKIMCSIFIYFGVACIGLLLGSYLASMLDDKSYKQAQRNRVENCTNCIRLKNIEKVQLRRQRKQKAAYYHKRQTSTKAQPMRGFMSERNSHDISHLGPHTFEREQKRVRTQRSPKSHSPSSAASGSSEFATRKAFNDDSPTSVPGSNEDRTAERESDKNESASDNQVSENKDDGRSDYAKPDEVKEVIDSYPPPSDVMMSPEATSKRLATGGSPGSMFGSPLTADILGRQTHTRHMSLGGNDLDLTASAKRTTRPRGYSADLTRPQFAETIPEDAPMKNQLPKSWSRQAPNDESESESDINDESTVSETSTEDSDVTLDEAISRVKTAKYVILTLKQALMNSILIILIGGLGFFTIEGMSAVDSFYFTTVLLTTVGYGDIVPVTSAGKLFATVYVLVAGTVLLHNMSLISFIPLELRKRRIEQAVLTQFGDQLDDAVLRELATGPLVQNLQLSTHSATGLDECTRETFALAMLVRLGKVSETDIKQTFKAFRRLDVDDEGVLTTRSIITGMVHKHRSSRSSNRATSTADTMSGRSQPPPPPPPPFVEETEARRPLSKYWFGKHGSLHVRTEQDSYRFVGPEEYDNPPDESERSSLMGSTAGYDSFRSQQGAFRPDLEQGYYPGMYQQREEARRPHME